MRRIFLEVILPGLFFFVVYLGVGVILLPSQATWSPDEGAKLLQLQSVEVKDSRLLTEIHYQGRDLDPNLTFIPHDGLLIAQDNKLLFRRLPLFALLSKPLYALFGSYGLYLIPAFFGALMGVITLHLVPAYERRPLMWVLLVFASPVTIYASLFWEHTLGSAIALAGGWILLTRYSDWTADSDIRGLIGWIIIGTLLALSAYIRLETVIFSLALLIAYLLVARNWRVLVGAAAFVLMLAPYFPLHDTLFGQPIPDNAAYLARPFVYLSKAGSVWQATKDLLIGPAMDRAINTGLLGDLWVIAAALTISRSFDPLKVRISSKIKWAALLASAVIASVFLFTTREYHSAHGLLFTTPWLLLAIARSREVWEKGSTQAKTIVVTVIVGLAGYIVGILFLRSSFPHGGLEWGSRFFMTFFPFVAIMAGWGLDEKQQANVLVLVTVGGMLLLGLGFQLRGLAIIRQDKQLILTLDQELDKVVANDYAITTDIWWLPYQAPLTYFSSAIYVTENNKASAVWIALSQEEEISDFVMVTLDRRWPFTMAQVLDDYSFSLDHVEKIDNIRLFYFSRE